MIALICIIVAIILFILAALPRARSWYLPIGLAFFALGHIISSLPGLHPPA